MHLHTMLIYQLFDFFNGIFEEGLSSITTSDFRFISNLGSDLNLEETIEGQNKTSFHVHCQLETITKISNEAYKVKANFEIVEKLNKFNKRFLVIVNVTIKNNLIERVYLQFHGSEASLSLLKKVRLNIINAD